MKIEKIAQKLRKIADEIEPTINRKTIFCEDFELEKLCIVGRKKKRQPFAPVFIFETDLAEIINEEVTGDTMKLVKELNIYFEKKDYPARKELEQLLDKVNELVRVTNNLIKLHAKDWSSHKIGTKRLQLSK